MPLSCLEHLAFETLPVLRVILVKKRGFRQNLRRLVAAAAFAPEEQFQDKIAPDASPGCPWGVSAKPAHIIMKRSVMP